MGGDTKASKTFIVTESSAQSIYDELLTNRPKHFLLYEEDQEHRHIYVRFPMVVGRNELEVTIVQVSKNVSNELIAWVLPETDTKLMQELATHPRTDQAQIVLGQFLSLRLQEIEFLKRMTVRLPGYILTTKPGPDPILEEFI